MPKRARANLATILVLLTLAAASLPSSARAAEPPGDAYRASPGCPDRAEFDRLVRESSAAGAAPAYVVTLDATPTGAHGRARVLDRVAGARDREIDGDTCANVARALALAVALLASPAREDARGDSTSAPGSATPPSREPPPAPFLGAGPDRDAARSRHSGGPYGGLSAAATLSTSSGAANVAQGIDAEVEIGASGAVSASVLLGFAYSAVDADNGGAHETWRLALGHIDGCLTPVSFGDHRLELGGCGRVGVGALTVGASDVVGGTTRTRPWVELDVVLRVRLAISGPLALEGGFGPIVPLIRDDLVIRPDAHVLEAPPAGVFASLGLGVRFP